MLGTEWLQKQMFCDNLQSKTEMQLLINIANNMEYKNLIDFVYYLNDRYYSKFIIDTEEVDNFLNRLKER